LKAPKKSKAGGKTMARPTIMSPKPFTVEIRNTQSDKTRLTVTERRSGHDSTLSWDVPVKCLFCDMMIEDVLEDPEADEDKDVDMEKNESVDEEAEARRKTRDTIDDEVEKSSEDSSAEDSVEGHPRVDELAGKAQNNHKDTAVEDTVHEATQPATTDKPLTTTNPPISDSITPPHTPSNRPLEEEDEKEEEEEGPSIFASKVYKPVERYNPTAKPPASAMAKTPTTDVDKEPNNGTPGKTISSFIRLVTTDLFPADDEQQPL
jgi:hypothetical protein